MGPAPANPTAHRDGHCCVPRNSRSSADRLWVFGYSSLIKPAVGQVVWVSGRRPHSRLPQIGRASQQCQQLRTDEQTKPRRLPSNGQCRPLSCLTGSARPRPSVVPERGRRAMLDRGSRKVQGASQQGYILAAAMGHLNKGHRRHCSMRDQDKKADK